MKDALVSSTILVLVILLIRGLFRNKLSFRFQYFLWFFVAARLLLFFVTLPQSTISVMNLFQWESGIKNEQVLQNEALSVEVASDTLENSNTDASNSVTNKSNPGQMGSEPTKATFTLWNITKWAKIIWVAGSIILASYFIFYDFHILRSLKNKRVDSSEMGTYVFKDENRSIKSFDISKIHYVKDLPTACVFAGKIYLPDSLSSKDPEYKYVVAHEMAHVRHLDSLWNMVRKICLCLFWFDPFVWIAAYESKKDCELACDESAIHLLGDGERIHYGEVLLQMVSNRKHQFSASNGILEISGNKKEVKERIIRIRRKRRNSVIAAMISGIIMCSVVVIVFTSHTKAEDNKINEIEKDTEQLQLPSMLEDEYVTRIEQNFNGLESNIEPEKSQIIDHYKDSQNRAGALAFAFGECLGTGDYDSLYALSTNLEYSKASKDIWDQFSGACGGREILEKGNHALYTVSIPLDKETMNFLPGWDGKSYTSLERFLYLVKIDGKWFIDGPLHNSFPDESWWDGKNIEWDVYDYGFSDADDTGKITYDQNGYDTWITECYERYGLEFRLN